MWSKFKAAPTSVKLSISFLVGIVASAIAVAPAIAIPVIMIIGTAVSLVRVLVYLTEGK